MGFFSDLVKGALGVATGGISNILLGGSSGGPAAPSPASMPKVVPTGENQVSPMSPETMSFLRAYLSQPPPTYNAQAALAGAPGKQATAQQGGMAYPGTMATDLRRRQTGGLGAGSSKGDDAENQYYRENIQKLMGRMGSQYTGPSAPAFGQYMQRALSGQQTLPAESYQRAMREGMQTVNAQAALSRQALTGALGSRGLLRSGLTARGLTDVERARLGGISSLVGGLKQQGLEAQRQAQSSAAAIYPQLVGVESSAMRNMVESLLQQREMELRYGQLGVNQRQAAAAEDAARWSALGNLAAGYFQYKYWPREGQI